MAFAYNTSVHACTNYTAYYLTHGREARVPVDVLVPSQLVGSDLPLSHADFVASLAERLGTAFAGARQGAATAHEKQKLYYDGSVRHQPYVVGDLVWLHNPTEDRMKLALHWKGPYRVLSVLGSRGEPGLTYHISSPLDFDGQGQVVHYDRLKPYTLPMAAGFSDSLPASPLHAPSLLDEGSPEGDFAGGEPLASGDTGTGQITGTGEPRQTFSRCGRTVRNPVSFEDFVLLG